MANCCNFEMMIKGEKENIRKIIGYLEADYNYNDKESLAKINKHFFRIDSIAILDERLSRNEYVVLLSGECAWSVYSCMFSGEGTYYNSWVNDVGKLDDENNVSFKGTCMEEATKELNLKVEIFSEEIGVGFMEHFVVDKGEIVIDECTDYGEKYNEEEKDHYTIGGIELKYKI